MSENKTEIVISAVNNADQAFRQINSQFGDLSKRAETFNGKLQKLSGGLAALGVSVSAGAFATWIKGAIDMADEMGKMSQKVGISVESLSVLKYAGELADVSLEQLGIGMKQLSKNMMEAATGGKDQVAAFKALGVEYRNADGTMRSADDVFRDLADRFSGMEDGAAKTAIAMKLFGKSGSDMIPLLNSGAKGLREAADETQRFGQTISQETAKKAEEFNDNLRKLKLSSSGLGLSIANDLLPPLTRLTEKLDLLVQSEGWNKFWEHSGKFLYTFIPLASSSNYLTEWVLNGKPPGWPEKPEDLSGKKFPMPPRPSEQKGTQDAVEAYYKELKLQEEKLKKFREIEAGMKRIEDLNKSIQDQTAKISLTELELVDRQGAAWLKEGADRIKVEKWVAAEKDKIITSSMRKAFTAMEQRNAKLADIEHQRARENAEWISNQVNAYADAIAKMMKELDQQQESGIRGKIYNTDTQRQYFIGSDQENLEDQVKNYQELLALKMKEAELYGDTWDQSGWEAQQQAIADTRRELLGLNKELQKYTGSTSAALGEGVNQYLRDMPTEFEAFSKLAGDALQGTEDALVDFVKNGKLDFSSLIDSMIEDLARLSIQQAFMKPLGDWFSSLFDNSGSGSSINLESWGGLPGGLLGSYATGTNYVPKTGPYLLHQGERVTPAGEGSPAYSVSVTNNLDGFNRLSSELRTEVEDLVVRILRKHS